jgi:hypothetical protein
LPRTLTLTLESSCPHRDGLTVELELDTAYYPDFVWRNTTPAVWPEPLAQEEPYPTVEHNFCLWCRNGDDVVEACGNNRFWLGADTFPGGCATTTWPTLEEGGPECGISGRGRCSDEYACDPVEIRFGPGVCEGSGPPLPPPSCTETLVVTL